MKTGLFLLGGFLLASAACGGSVVFEEDGGQGGSGGTGTTGSNPTKTTSVGPTTTGTTSPAATAVGTTDSGTSSVVGTSTGSGSCSLPNTNPPNNCQQACSDLFDCGLLFCDGGQLCPGFNPMDKMQFMGGCMNGCQDQMAIISIVDPFNCDVTVDTLSAVTQEFAFVCQNGF